MRAPVVEPRTTYTPHGAGLARVGQPGPSAPHGDVPTPREPGIYAGSSDPSSDLLYPPAKGELAGVSEGALTRCAQSARRIFGAQAAWAFANNLGTLTQPENRCLYGRELADCLGIFRLQAELRKDEEWAKAWDLETAKASLRKYRDTVCWGLIQENPPSRVKQLLDTAARWRRDLSH